NPPARSPFFATSSSALSAEQRLRVAVRDLRRNLRRQLREPGTIAGHDVAVALPALVDPGVGAEQETVWIALEQRAPFSRQLAAPVDDATAVRQFAPQFWIF